MASADPRREKGDKRKDDEVEEEEERKRQQPSSQPGEPESKEDSRKRAPKEDTPPSSQASSQRQAMTGSPKKHAHRSEHSSPGNTQSTRGQATSGKAKDPHIVVREKILYLPRPPSRSRLSDSPSRPSRRYHSSDAVPFDDGWIPEHQRPGGAERGVRGRGRWWDPPEVDQSHLPAISPGARWQVNENIEQDLFHRGTRPTPKDQVDYLKPIIDNLPSYPGSRDSDFKLSLIPSVSLRRATPLPETKLQYQTQAFAQERRQAGGEGSAGAVGGHSPGKNHRRRLRSRSGPHDYFSQSSFVPREDKKETTKEAGDRQQGSPTKRGGDDSEASGTEKSDGASGGF